MLGLGCICLLANDVAARPFAKFKRLGGCSSALRGHGAEAGEE